MANYCRTNHPIAYMLTWTTYGTWLHGNNSGSADRKNNSLIEENKELEAFEKSLLKGKSFVMNSQHQQIVLEAILEVCRFRNWNAYAAHIRTNHVHVIVSAAAVPEKVMNDFKTYTTRALRKQIGSLLPQKIWTRHGSTKYIWNESELSAAFNYVKDGQGKMTAFGENVIGQDVSFISQNIPFLKNLISSSFQAPTVREGDL